MNYKQAETIAKSGKITWGELQATLQQAYDAGAADDRRGTVNNGLDKATMFNIMSGYAKEYTPDQVVSLKRWEWLGAVHILREFGEFWEGWMPEIKRKTLPPPHHSEAVNPEFPF